MKRRRTFRGAGSFCLSVLFGLLFTFGSIPAGAQDPCEDVALVDEDKDGFWDCQESKPIMLCGQIYNLTVGQKDLFVILVRASDLDPSATSNIPYETELGYFDPFALAKNLGVNIHIIPYFSADQCEILDTRVVNDSPLQKALKITEDLRTSVSEVGISTPGMPAGKDEATVYTARIWQKLVEACPCIVNNCDTCTDSTGQIKGKALFPLYIQNIIAHELGHMARPLVYPYTTKYEYHYKEGDYTIMERAIVATTDKKTKNVKIPISSQYKEEDRSNVQIVR